MAYIAKRHVFIAFIAVISALALCRADIKLRIYMKDGSLQAGNLITEGANSFVILGKDGRVEVFKNQIMFVNGKTLAQWEAQPNKTYQTEILPTEVPNPAYVNDKAVPPPPIKPYSAIKGVIPPGKNVQRAPVEEKSVDEGAGDDVAETTSVDVSEDVLPPPPPPTAVKEKVQPKIVKDTAPPVVMPIRKTQRKATPKKYSAASTANVRKKEPVPATVQPVSPLVFAKKEISIPAKPKVFSREALSDYHHARAVEFLGKGETGHGIQQLHLAAILNRGSEKSMFLLGKIYHAQGVFAKAEKYLGNPLLRKNDEAKRLLADMVAQEKKNKFKPWMLSGVALGGVLAGVLPLIFISRKMRSGGNIQIVSDARQKEGNVSEVEAADKEELKENIGPDIRPSERAPKSDIVEKSDATENISERGADPAQIPMDMAPPPAPVSINAAVPILSDAAADHPVAVPPMEERPKEIEKAVDKDKDKDKKIEKPEPMFSPTTEELIKKLQRPVEPPKIAHEPLPVLPEPVAQGKTSDTQKPTFEVLQPDPAELLERAALVEYAIQKGNELAGAGDFMKAEREYRTAIALNAQCQFGYVGLGYICFMHGQWEMALEYYVKALSINPDSADAHYGIGRVLLETNREAEAVSELQKALNLDPTFADARDTLSYLGKLA